jgi:hypothetical protein
MPIRQQKSEERADLDAPGAVIIISDSRGSTSSGSHDKTKQRIGVEIEGAGHRHANLDFRLCNSSIRESSCCRARSLAFLSSSSFCSRDCFSSTIDLRTVTTSRLASVSSFRRASIVELRVSRSLASSVACNRAFRTM